MKKFIVINGKKVYIDEKDVQEDDGKEATEGTDPSTLNSTAADDDDKAVEEAAKSIAQAVSKQLGIDELKDSIRASQNILNRPENAKLREILHGKDLEKKDQLTKEEKIVGFFHALVTKNDTVVKALSEGVNADGGYLFPAEFLAELIKSLTEPPYARSLVRVVPMRRNVMNIPSLVNRPKVYWTGENVAKTTTTANFGQQTLTAKKAAAILYASDELVEDSTELDVVQLIIGLFAEAVGIEENRVIIAGNGTTQPMGIFTTGSNGITTITAGGNLSLDLITNLVYALKSMYRAGASFLVHPENVAELRKLKDTTGRYLWVDAAPGVPGDVTQARPATLMGYPVYEFYDADTTKIAFGNWKLAYWLGDRKAMTVKISNDTETAFTKDQTAIRVVFRIAGTVVLPDAARVLVSLP
ncbi:MAG TPA: phage major capsid protein [Patescibacteria group bacterium]|nr:phage major capsid protein [Patescibacteria group bacterium]